MEALASPQKMVHRVGFLAGGIGGVALGFKQAKGTWMFGDTPIEYEYELVGSVDNDPNRNREFERLVGAPAHTVDLFTRRDYIAFHSEFRDVQDDTLGLVLNTRLKKGHGDSDGLIEHDGRRYWRYQGHWAEVIHWSPPPDGWQEVGPEDMRQIFGGEAPDCIFASMPCQGNSRLLSEAKAATWKYTALNNLVPRAFYLTALAWPDKPVKIMFSENVPGIKYRSKDQLDDMQKAAKKFGFATHMGDHDAGKKGGCAQSRPRFFWVQRHEETCPQFLFEPLDKPLKAIKDVLWDKPFPGDPMGGSMHTLPKLDFITWLRLSLIPPGGDWKDIPGPGEWQLRTLDGRVIPPEAICETYVSKKGETKTRWFAPDPAVWGKVFVAELLPGAKHYADIRLQHNPMGNGRGAYWVQDPREASGTLTADPSHRKSGGASCVADDRMDVRCPDKESRHASHMRVTADDEPAGVATGATHLGNGAQACSDSRLNLLQSHMNEKSHGNKYSITAPHEPTGTVTGTRFGSGAPGVADARVGLETPKFNDAYNVTAPEGTSKTVGGGTGPGGGGHSIADARLEFSDKRHSVKYKMQPDGKEAQCITTQTDVQTGAPCMPDSRIGFSPRDNAYHVADPDKEAPAIPGSCSVTSSNGPGAVADPRFRGTRYDGSLQVMPPDQPTPPIIGATNVTTSNGPGAVSDPRITRKAKGGTMSVHGPDDAANTITTHTDHNGDAQGLADARMNCASRNGTLGVVAWTGPSPAVIASLDVYAGQAAIEDVRINIHWWPDWFPSYLLISPWNAWHRPLTDWELWILQTFPAYDEEGQAWEISGSRADRRKAIGNAVPPWAAKAYAHALAPTLIVAKLMPEAFLLSPTGGKIWVDPFGRPVNQPQLQ